MPGLSCMHSIFIPPSAVSAAPFTPNGWSQWRSKIKQPLPLPCRAATQIARTHPVPSACSSSLEASLARASWGQPASIGRRPTALGTLAFRILRGHRGVSGGRRPSPFQWASDCSGNRQMPTLPPRYPRSLGPQVRTACPVCVHTASHRMLPRRQAS